MHRLDYATLDVLLVDLSKHATSIASSQFQRRDAKKVDVAPMHGVVERDCVFHDVIAEAVPPGYRTTVRIANNVGRGSLTKCVAAECGRCHGARVPKVNAARDLHWRRRRVFQKSVYAATNDATCDGVADSDTGKGKDASKDASKEDEWGEGGVGDGFQWRRSVCGGGD